MPGFPSPVARPSSDCSSATQARLSCPRGRRIRKPPACGIGRLDGISGSPDLAFRGRGAGPRRGGGGAAVSGVSCHALCRRAGALPVPVDGAAARLRRRRALATALAAALADAGAGGGAGRSAGHGGGVPAQHRRQCERVPGQPRHVVGLCLHRRHRRGGGPGAGAGRDGARTAGALARAATALRTRAQPTRAPGARRAAEPAAVRRSSRTSCSTRWPMCRRWSKAARRGPRRCSAA